MISGLAVYGGLFMASLIAATLIPAQSEAVLIGLIVAGGHNVWLLVAAATVGNVLGSLINWILGRGVERFRDKKWFPVKPAAMARAERFYQRFGKWSLLLSWAPVIGDPLTLIAGVLKEPIVPFLLIVTVAKAARYIVLALLTLGWLA